MAEGPYGAMTAARRTRRDVLLIAGGVGITPMRALFETLPLAPGQDLTLLYRARNPEDLVFRHELDQVARYRGARVHYLLGADPGCLSAPAPLRLFPNLTQRDVYLCGSPGCPTPSGPRCATPGCRRKTCTRNASRSDHRWGTLSRPDQPPGSHRDPAPMRVGHGRFRIRGGRKYTGRPPMRRWPGHGSIRPAGACSMARQRKSPPARTPPGSGDLPVPADLDSLAERYARDRARCSAAERDALREEMIRQTLPFAGRLARRYRSYGETTDDLEQVARLGLIKAVDRYDPGRGSFTAYAVMTITGELKRHFRDHTWSVHVPRRLQNLSLQMEEASAALRHTLHRRPTDAELATSCNVDPDDIAAAKISAAGYRSASLNVPVGDGGAEVGDRIGVPDAAFGLVEDRVSVAYLMSRLPQRERQLLYLRFFENRTQAETATELGLAQMHVSRLLARALGWLREGMLTDAVPRWPTGDPADDGRLTITTGTARSGTVQVDVAGEIDRDNARHLSDTLLSTVCHATAGQHVAVDLTRVPLLDAAGAAALLAVHQSARVRNVSVAVVGLQPQVRQIAVLCGLRPLLG
jgi:RNA polymerase sigma-B factor